MICRQLQQYCLGGSDKEKTPHMLNTHVTLSEYFDLSLADVDLTGMEGYGGLAGTHSSHFPLLNDSDKSIILKGS